MSRDVYIIRLTCAMLGFLLVFGLLLRHVYTLQVTRHEELFTKARAKYITSSTREGKKGRILDRKGNLLAGNVATKDVLAEPGRCQDQATRDRVVATLATELDVPVATLRERFESGLVEVVVKRHVDLDSAQVVAELKLPGVRMVDSSQRYYPKKQLLAQTLGFTDVEGEGMVGLEQVWNDEMAPRSTKETWERSRRGTRLNHDLQQAPEIDGKDIYLTIEEPIQHIMETELAKLAAEHNPRYAFAIMTDPKTGAILGMAQYPSFDPNDRSEMDPDQWRNHMVEDVFEPGSIMKACSIAGGIDYGVVDMDTYIDCTKAGIWYYRGKPLRDAGHAFGTISVRKIITVSSNIGTAKVALAMGDQRLYQTMLRFGYGQRTEIGLPHESRGILHHPDKWDGLTITRMPMGKSVAITPLQAVQAYNALANDGLMMKLHLIDRIEDPSTGEVESVEPELKRIVARRSSIEQIVDALVTVTEDEEGTAHKARIPGYRVAGKTGTSKKVINGSYQGHRKYYSSFIGFAPAYEPAFVLLVVADEPTGKYYYGGSVCGPTFARIGEQALRYLNIQPIMEDGAPSANESRVVNY